MCTVSISVDGLKETHEKFRKVPNCYEKILKAIDMLNQSDVVKIVQVTTVANKKNINELEDIYKLLLEHNVQYWRVVNCDPIGRAKDNGDIFVCSNVPRLPEFIQENIKTDSFVNVWETKFKPFRHEDRTSSEKCKACEYWNYCWGDSFHTYDFDNNEPTICLKPIFDEL